ncbi:unnamed protein product [Echinostoma caproni]|uniref:Reverse transcriptase domain-containing protein n=1 Tax=Echinostoma caproni TaxID=27848 RepID=A0A183A385_9TREM|nr:unnamed protein product [Echinostoma caproni]
MSNIHTHLQRLVVKCSNNTRGMNIQPTKLEVDGEHIFLKRRVIPYGQRDGLLQALEKMQRDGIITRVTSNTRATPIVIAIKSDGKTPQICIFQAAIDEVIRGIDAVLAYHDDVIVFGTTKAEHDDRLLKLQERFDQKNVSIRASKCMFSSPELECLGFAVDAKG